MPADDRDLLAAISRTQARIRELETIVALIAVRHGQAVGLGTWQLRISEREAFDLRSELPAARDVAVTVTYDDGFLVTCI